MLHLPSELFWILSFVFLTESPSYFTYSNLKYRDKYKFRIKIYIISSWIFWSRLCSLLNLPHPLNLPHISHIRIWNTEISTTFEYNYILYPREYTDLVCVLYWIFLTHWISLIFHVFESEIQKWVQLSNKNIYYILVNILISFVFFTESPSSTFKFSNLKYRGKYNYRIKEKNILHPLSTPSHSEKSSFWLECGSNLFR